MTTVPAAVFFLGRKKFFTQTESAVMSKIALYIACPCIIFKGFMIEYQTERIMGLGMVALGLAVATPFFVAGRLRKFRDEGREGQISFRRSYAYTIFVFFYGAVLLAVVQFLYFAYVDNGYLLSSFSRMLSSEEGKQLVTQYGMSQMVEESLSELASIRPIDYALNILTVNIMIGFVLGIPISLFLQRSHSVNNEL
jgi:hypothetical protein